ncbi:MAG: hypothetical protein QOJ65_1858 [Fimbriimonadaceae bacterium]|jgi:hypothetical protein|nr:hypothetical protein [Fimbriimonadaceae bacterium]
MRIRWDALRIFDGASADGYTPRMHKAVIVLGLSASLLSCATAADQEWAKFASGTGSVMFLAAGTLLPLARDGGLGREHSLRAFDSLAVSVAFSEGLKRLTRVKRPDSSERDSFPSGHATAAFAVAAMESEFHPREAPLWYAGAAAIADSRVVLHRHRWADVVGGAALGYGVARWELSSPRGLLIQPFMGENHSFGLTASGRF